MALFDYDAPAELFAAPRRGLSSKNAIKYHRFSTSASAIQFIVEELPLLVQCGAELEVDEDRFEAAEIRELYDNPRYPLKRNVK